MLVKSASKMYELDHHTANGQRVVDTDRLNPAGYIRRIFVGELKMSEFNRYMVLRWLKASRWRLATDIDLEKSTVTIMSMPSSIHRMSFYVSLDGYSQMIPISWRKLGYRATQLELFDYS